MEGFAAGAGVQLNYARGSGDWAGPFYNIGGNFGPVSGGAFSSSPTTMSPGMPAWSGYSGGIGIGAPIGAFTNVTVYQPVFTISF